MVIMAMTLSLSPSLSHKGTPIFCGLKPTKIRMSRLRARGTSPSLRGAEI
jgi:hypothetical protein